MGAASFAQSSFLGGEWSKTAQGRFDLPEYRTAMNVCFNSLPLEEGAWTRRGGTSYAGHTHGGSPGRVVKFDFSTFNPYTVEMTDGFFRFRTGTILTITNDSVGVSSISAANPAVVQTASPTTWATGNTITFPIVAGPVALANRQFVITVVDSTHFSIVDALTGVAINGATLGAVQAGMTVGRIQEVATPYVAGTWASVRFVQSETTAVTLQGTLPPQLLQVTTLPTNFLFAQFSLLPLTFLDGPYLDPFTNGVQAVPNALSGNIQLSLAFPAYVATKAYKIGDFVTSAAINYQSLTDNNVNNTPAGSPSNWQPVSAGAAINNGQGFLGTDVGRLVRLLNEPALWNPVTAYVAGNIVAYNPNIVPGGSTYWVALVNNTNKIPGNDTTTWAPATNTIIWTWGKITSLATQISQALGTAFGTMTSGGGVAAAFDGIISQPAASSAEATQTFNWIGTGAGAQHTFNIDADVGKNFTGTPQKVSSATIFPPNNQGFASVSNIFIGGVAIFSSVVGPTATLNLRAKASSPASPSDGTLLGSLAVNPSSLVPVTITSNDQSTTWNFVWVEIVASVTQQNTGFAGGTTFTGNAFTTFTAAIAEVQFFSPPGTGSGNAINVEILGPPLLNTNPSITWRLGAYSNTTGFPTCGTYHEGRIWLGGVFNNRFDASVPNSLVGTTINFAPTDQNGVVTANNAVTYTLTSDGVNPILWMEPDQQGVIMGTLVGEWLAFAPTTSAGLGPTNIAARRVTKIGGANVLPVRTDHTLLFVQRFAKRLMEYFADIFSGKFNAPNIAHRAFQIVQAGIAELAYTTSKTPTVWGRNLDGTWWGISYKRDTLTTSQGPTTVGWHRHSLGSGRIVESIAFSPQAGGILDTVAMVTNDPATGIRHVEVLNDTFDEGEALAGATFVDDSVVPLVVQTPTGVTLNGLTIHNGKTVTVLAGGLDAGDFVVANGAVTVPFGFGIDNTGADQFTAAYLTSITPFPFLVGFTYTSDGQIVRPMDAKEGGSKNGPAAFKIRREHWVGALFQDCITQSIKMGADFNHLRTVYFKSTGGKPLTVLQKFSGVDSVPFDDTYSFDGMLAWRVSRPNPCTIVAVGGFLHTQDK